MKRYFTTVFIIFSIILSCQKSTDPINALRLELQDVSCTEAWLEVTGGNGSTVIINRDGVKALEVTLTGSGAVVYDDSLLPNTSYTYQAVNPQNGQQSPALPVTTMDTTSHEFTWQIYEFGGYSSSYFKDAAIISENDIWAVGEIVTPEGDYNAAHWDGEKWELIKIIVKLNYGNGNIIITDNDPIKTLFYTSDKDIWFVSSAGGVTKYNEYEWQYFIITPGVGPGGANKIWGVSSSNIYFVRNNGQIRHYNGQEWTKIESGTELDIQDIWGSWNEKTGEYEILCVASNVDGSREIELIKIENTRAKKLAKEGLRYFLDSVWFKAGSKYYITGSGIFYNRATLGSSSWTRYPSGSVTNYHTDRIRGNDVNDITAAGSGGEIVHFNGLTWKNYSSEINGYRVTHYSVDMKSKIIAAVGTSNNKAAVVIGAGE
jgi:hypothetical protein